LPGLANVPDNVLAKSRLVSPALATIDAVDALLRGSPQWALMLTCRVRTLAAQRWFRSVTAYCNGSLWFHAWYHVWYYCDLYDIIFRISLYLTQWFFQNIICNIIYDIIWKPQRPSLDGIRANCTAHSSSWSWSMLCASLSSVVSCCLSSRSNKFRGSQKRKRAQSTSASKSH
jgi:hypothetical protein